MTSIAWIKLTDHEIELLVKALALIQDPKDVEESDALSAKLSNIKEPYPKITVGVFGGQVQWALGNPFPVRVCDYDGEEKDLPSVDERGQRCRIWFEAPDTSVT